MTLYFYSTFDSLNIFPSGLVKVICVKVDYFQIMFLYLNYLRIFPMGEEESEC